MASSVDRPALISLADNNGLKLSPGQARAIYSQDLPVQTKRPVELWGIMPHMHLRGRQQRVELFGRQRHCLSDVKAWDFHWQDLGLFKEPVIAAPNDTLRITCSYDTSADTQAVKWGEGTSDEMCLAAVLIAYPNGL